MQAQASVAKAPKSCFQISWGAKCEFRHHAAKGSLRAPETLDKRVSTAARRQKGHWAGPSGGSEGRAW